MSTHNIPFLNIKKKMTINYPKSASMRFFQGTQERVRNIRGKRAIGVRAIEDLLYSVVSAGSGKWRTGLYSVNYMYEINKMGLHSRGSTDQSPKLIRLRNISEWRKFRALTVNIEESSI